MQKAIGCHVRSWYPKTIYLTLPTRSLMCGHNVPIYSYCQSLQQKVGFFCVEVYVMSINMQMAGQRVYNVKFNWFSFSQHAIDAEFPRKEISFDNWNFHALTKLTNISVRCFSKGLRRKKTNYININYYNFR